MNPKMQMKHSVVETEPSSAHYRSNSQSTCKLTTQAPKFQAGKKMKSTSTVAKPFSHKRKEP